MEPLTLNALAKALQEPNRPLLRQVLRTLGPARAAALLEETLAVESAGGVLTKDGTRRRTPGGTFFHLARRGLTRTEIRRLFPYFPEPKTATSPQEPPPTPPLTWETLAPLIATLATTPAGEARTMKLTLIGRPGKTEVRQQCVIFRMQGKPPGNLPRGLPAPRPTPPLTWTVLMALRQWNRVKDSITTNTEDQLVIEGYPTLQGTEHVLLAQSCISVAMQRALKETQRAAAEAQSAAAPPPAG